MNKLNEVNDVCVFCYNYVEESVKPRSSEKSQTVNVFCKLLGRICRKTFNVSSLRPVLATCEDCVNIIDSFNELYHQVECLKLQMEWRLDKVKNVIKCADKIPSKVKRFRNRYSIPKEQQNGGNVDEDEYNQLVDTRNAIQLYVSEHLSNVFPRVQLAPVRNSRLCCFPIVGYHQKELSTSATMERSPQISCASDTVSEQLSVLKDNRSSLEVTEVEHCFEQSLSPVNKDHAVTHPSVPRIPLLDSHNLEGDVKKLKTASDIVHLDPNSSFLATHMEVDAEDREHEQDQLSMNLQLVDEYDPEFGNETPPTRRLRSKFKCKNCSITFSTDTRLSEHRQSCSKEYKTEVEDGHESTCENDRASDVSDREMRNEEDSDSNDSAGNLSDDEPNVEIEPNEKINPLLNLTMAEVCNKIKSLVDVANATISCPEESCSQKYFTQGDLSTHSKQHGTFPCNFCPVEKSFAPTLALHELQHVAIRSAAKRKANINCCRCSYSTCRRSSYARHHLKIHLHLSPDTVTVTCPICLQNIISTGNIKRHLADHYLRHHRSSISDPADLRIKTKHKPDARRKGSLIITDDGMTIDDLIDASNAKWPCPVATCKLLFFTEDDLTSHAKLHGSFKCKLCPTEKRFAPDLAYHEILEHTKKDKSPRFKCSRCDFKYDKIKRCVHHHIKVHLKLPPATATISCPSCEQTFNGTMFHSPNGSQELDKRIKKSLVSHFVSFHDKSKVIAPASLFNCEHCPAYFLVQNQLSLHVKRVHPEQSCIIRCANCCRQFEHRSYLLHHRTTVHHGNDESGYEFVCEVPNCSRRYEYECDLQRHTVSHSIYGLNTCPECGKVILNKACFDKHVKSHQGHVCDRCGKKFQLKHQLRIHMLYHAGPDSWEFVCDICSVKCITKTKLKRHQQTHLETKAYMCETCGTTYAQRSSWKYHMVKHHGFADIRKYTKTKNFERRTKQQVTSKRKKLKC